MLLVIFSTIGVLFSGFLSLSKLLAGSCPLSEGCPLFLGHPACYTGFVFFALLLILSLIQLRRPKSNSRGLLKALIVTAALAVLFALYSTYKDLFQPNCPGGVCHYSLLLPTCVYGLFMYLVILVKAILLL